MERWDCHSGIVTVVAVAGTLVLAPGPAASQEPPQSATGERDEERCFCVEMPELPQEIAEWSDRARLGVRIDDEPVGGPGGEPPGVAIRGVAPRSSARDAGLREGDIIVSLDGRSLTDPLPGSEEDELDDRRSLPVQRLVALLRDHEPGDSVRVGYVRGGERREVRVELMGGPGALSAVLPSFDAEALESRIRRSIGRQGPLRWMETCRDLTGPVAPLSRRCVAGLEVQTMNPDLGRYFGADSGVLVLDVAEEGAPDVVPGDVILALDGRGVDDTGTLDRILRSYEAGEQVEMRIRRNDREQSLTVSVP